MLFEDHSGGFGNLIKCIRGTVERHSRVFRMTFGGHSKVFRRTLEDSSNTIPRTVHDHSSVSLNVSRVGWGRAVQVPSTILDLRFSPTHALGSISSSCVDELWTNVHDLRAFNALFRIYLLLFSFKGHWIVVQMFASSVCRSVCKYLFVVLFLHSVDHRYDVF